jgi:hypothetical protein
MQEIPSVFADVERRFSGETSVRLAPKSVHLQRSIKEQGQVGNDG